MSMTKEEKKEYKKKLKQMNREEVEHYKFQKKDWWKYLIVHLSVSILHYYQCIFEIFCRYDIKNTVSKSNLLGEF